MQVQDKEIGIETDEFLIFCNHIICQKCPKIQFNFSCGFLICALYFLSILQKCLWCHHANYHWVGGSLNKEVSGMLLVWVCCLHLFYIWGLILFEVNVLWKKSFWKPPGKINRDREYRKRIVIVPILPLS